MLPEPTTFDSRHHFTSRRLVLVPSTPVLPRQTIALRSGRSPPSCCLSIERFCEYLGYAESKSKYVGTETTHGKEIMSAAALHLHTICTCQFWFRCWSSPLDPIYIIPFPAEKINRSYLCEKRSLTHPHSKRANKYLVGGSNGGRTCNNTQKRTRHTITNEHLLQGQFPPPCDCHFHALCSLIAFRHDSVLSICATPFPSRALPTLGLVAGVLRSWLLMNRAMKKKRCHVLCDVLAPDFRMSWFYTPNAQSVMLMMLLLRTKET